MTEKKIKSFVNNVQKGRLVNTVTATFNTIMGQMTKMSQRKKSPNSGTKCGLGSNGCECSFAWIQSVSCLMQQEDVFQVLKDPFALPVVSKIERNRCAATTVLRFPLFFPDSMRF